MKITIDNKKIKIDKPATVLDVAAQNDIYIPSLCAHPELVPYGGCRLCIVEIEGRRGYPTACTTHVEDGMVVRTDTKILKEMRTELTQLILSEHPSACMMCDDVEGCSVFQGTIRKVGITTGCRWCPKDKDCEFQRIVESLGIHDLTLPGLYRDIPIEKYDPFFDRDYNLCIYCGRCVRICNEYRKSSVLSLKQRGKFTTIGPAFEATHIDANCEFCGACVSVCPTGAMSEKSRKWWGVPEKYEASTCPLCSLNCDIQVLTLKDKIVGTLPPGVPHEAGGELCVKGRFCLSELVNRTTRILEPQFKYKEGYGFVSWEVANEKAVEIVKEVKPGRSAMLLSPSLNLEEIHFAKQFAEKALHTELISSSCINENLLAYMEMASHSVSLNDLKKAGCLLSIFLDGNYKYAPVTMLIKDLASKVIPYCQIGWTKDTTTRFATHFYVPKSGDVEGFLDKILFNLKKEKAKTKQPIITETLAETKNSAMIIGPEIMSLTNCISILDKLKQVAKQSHSMIYMPNPYGNLDGLLALVDVVPFDEIRKKIDKKEIDLLYLVGDSAFKKNPGVMKIIYQNAFPAPEDLQPDLILPTALWGESNGRYLNTDKKIKKSYSVGDRHGYSLPHRQVFLDLAKSLKVKLPKFSAKDLRKEFQLKLKPVPEKIKVPAPSKNYPFSLVQENAQHVYSSLNLSTGIEGFGDLVKADHILLHPSDARKQGFNNEEWAILGSSKTEKKFRVLIRKNIPKGIVLLTSSNGQLEFESNPCPVKIRRDHV
ncbi:MAG: (2Fe-2S)-binding protein [Bacteroidales bacterium]|nr:(2Fe-2S)-binding protein [Bacteroidales bacterium]MCF8454442.1 (2Fe-2S)-binding protein [Bacteroidales bacterium]